MLKPVRRGAGGAWTGAGGGAGGAAADAKTGGGAGGAGETTSLSVDRHVSVAGGLQSSCLGG